VATAPREQPCLDDELNAAGGRVDREHAQRRLADGRHDDERDTEKDRRAVGEQQRPLIAELRAAAEGDDELRRTADDGPDAEDYEGSRTLRVTFPRLTNLGRLTDLTAATAA
jgi:hypothetical protein